MRRLIAILLALSWSAAALALDIPTAVTSDPPADPKHPARMEVIHIPSGGEIINGVVYVAAGPGPHPTFVFFHGLPGNERNLDLVQAVRRAGWNAVAANYRGAWGSGGTFSFAGNLEDARAVLAFVRDPANAARLGIDPARIALGGHSMGGWVAAQTIARDPGLLGAAVISLGDMGRLGLLAQRDPKAATAAMDDNREALAGVTGESMAQELAAHGEPWTVGALAPRLVDRRLYVLYSDDFVKADSEKLIAAVRAAGGKTLEEGHVPTDHSWSDKRITLQAMVVNWLGTLR
jgi:uncharacterized protein